MFLRLNLSWSLVLQIWTREMCKIFDEVNFYYMERRVSKYCSFAAFLKAGDDETRKIFISPHKMLVVKRKTDNFYTFFLIIFNYQEILRNIIFLHISLHQFSLTLILSP